MYYSLIIKHFKFDLYEWGLDASEMGFYKAFSIFHFKQINLIFKKYTSIIFSTLFMFYLGQKKIMCVSDCIVFKIKVGR